jgi:hypothetical protein
MSDHGAGLSEDFCTAAWIVQVSQLWACGPPAMSVHSVSPGRVGHQRRKDSHERFDAAGALRHKPV